MSYKGMTVVDAHCHIYPALIARKATEHTNRFYSTEYSAYDGTAQTLIAKGQKAGIDLFLAESVATTPRQVSSINRFLARTAADHSCVRALGTLHPDSVDPAGDIKTLKELGLIGVKLHPDIQGIPADDKRMMNLYRLCAENDLPVLLHTGDKRFDFSNPNRLLPIIKAFPDLTLIGAHFGGYSDWDNASRVLADEPTFLVDCSSSFFALSRQTAAEILRRYGANRVLFGTDYPMWPIENELKTLDSLGLTGSELTAVLGGNAMRVFKLAKP